MPKQPRKKKPYRPKPPPPPPERALDSYTAAELMASTGCWPEQILIDVGVKLRDGRQTAPLEEQDGRSYDDCVGVSYAGLEVETCGFRITATPRRIGVREVAEYAKPSCTRCHGVGYWAVTRRAVADTDELGNKVMQDLEYEQSCGCADRNYRERFPRILVDSQLGEWIALDNLMISEASVPMEMAQ